jgi:hypothetical protein
MAPSLSVVVVAHDMERELPRTVATLDADYQLGIDADDYEIVVVDNGSSVPIAESMLSGLAVRTRLERIDPAPASPAQAANHGLEIAAGELIGLVIDGARMASPGLLATARRAARSGDRCVITSPAYHLGAVPHMLARDTGYDQQAEDALLAATGWTDDGYRLFGISVLGGSSSRGWFGPMGESSALFMSTHMWRELGGLDDRFALPGGGLVNHDLYRRACALPEVELFVLFGEGTFHQFHNGAATSRRLSWDEMHAEYASIRGESYVPPENSPTYIGRLPASAAPHLERSVELAQARRRRR